LSLGKWPPITIPRRPGSILAGVFCRGGAATILLHKGNRIDVDPGNVSAYHGYASQQEVVSYFAVESSLWLEIGAQRRH
jgi:hypothetical protein